MRKLLVKIVDVMLGVACLVALVVGWKFGQVLGVALALLGSALVGGYWAALSLVCEHLEQIRRNSDKQTKMLDALDYNVTSATSKYMNPEERPITAR